VQMTIRADAEIQDDGMYYIDGGFRISVGSVVYVRMPDYTGTAYCTEIKETEAAS